METISPGKQVGQVFWVTGASGNVGGGVAEAAYAAGASLVLPVRGASSRAALPVGLDPSRVLVGEVDAGDDASVVALRDQALARFGRVDHVISSLGGWWQGGASIEQPDDALRTLLGTYVEAPLRLARILAPALRTTGGTFTVVTGALGEGYAPGSGLLTLAVKGQFALSEILRRESAREAFRVNEWRIACRVERVARPGVVPARQMGDDLLASLGGGRRGELWRYSGPGRTVVVNEARSA